MIVRNFRRQIKPEKKNIADKIMTAFLFALVVPAILTSPTALYYLAAGAAHYYFKKQDFRRETRRLKKRGYIALSKTEKGWLIKLTKKGKTHLKRVEIENLLLPKPKTWDGKWRMFIFDIPEEFRNERNMLRRKLKFLGCYNIQRSVFVYPHPCKEELESVANYYKVAQFTLFAEVTEIDLEKELRKFFNL